MINRQQMMGLIVAAKFEEIFLEHLGWDSTNQNSFDLSVKFADINHNFNIDFIAEKRGFVVCAAKCKSIPPKDVRLKLERMLSKIHYEHILILCDEDGGQEWIVARKFPDKPMRLFQAGFAAKQEPHFLMGKLQGLVFFISEEGGLGIGNVVTKVEDAFVQGAEKITEQFYKQFSKELEKFQKFITGLQTQINKEQYAALMLNRLMFVYFIQNKGFLDGDNKYLQHRLAATKKEFGDNKFYKGFYRYFLIDLFHSGLGAPQQERTDKVNKLIGKVPYLNGGLFDQHALEQEYGADIDIADDAFGKLFDFFDEYNWYLDIRATASGKDINPDVIGYIFEKYINDRAKMGAYYTQEDITGYIARNTILPHLLRQTKKDCAEAFNKQNGTIWELLRQNPDRYIYAAVRHGCHLEDSHMPQNIACGLDAAAPDLLTRRQKWNTAAVQEWALPTEIWRETIARRSRYFALKDKITNGEIKDIAALVTHNLDIEKLTFDTLQRHEGSDFIAAFYFAIAGRQKMEGTNISARRGISILDPACGSGAFLFAALNVLEPLYEICISRMKEFVAENDELNKLHKTKAKKHKEFRRILTEMQKHGNEKYWIYRNIILGNLFGTDIMPEAVEVAKLRLFLKLAAEAEVDIKKDNMGLEPLPDIDFNIRAGNALVGFVDMQGFEQKAGKELDISGGLIDEIKTKAQAVGKAYSHFVNVQSDGVINNIGGADFKDSKNKLTKELGELNAQFNEYLAQSYGKTTAAEIYEWKESHKPFHWIAEFYEIINGGGFDVVIGNPPYVGYSAELRKQYTIKEYRTEKCGDLYAFFVERAKSLMSALSPMGMIIPISAFSTDNMSPLMAEIIKDKNIVCISCYSVSPTKLFVGAKQRLAIFLLLPIRGEIKITKYMQWRGQYRQYLLDTLEYHTTTEIKGMAILPKIHVDIELSIMQKMATNKKLMFFVVNKASNKNLIYYHNAPENWTRANNYMPYFWNQRDGEKLSGHMKKLYSYNENIVSLCALINSSLFYWWFLLMSNGRDLLMRELKNFPINLDEFYKINEKDIAPLVARLMDNYRSNAIRKETVYKNTTGKVIYDEFHPKLGKSIIDEIDKVLAKHYGFTDEELDYIINYAYKYRMGVKGAD